MIGRHLPSHASRSARNLGTNLALALAIATGALACTQHIDLGLAGRDGDSRFDASDAWGDGPETGLDHTGDADDAGDAGDAGSGPAAWRTAAGGYHSCGIRDDGSTWCWGANSFGQLGDNSFIDRVTPVAVSPLGPARAVCAGALHSCALLPDGTVWCWGSNEYGQTDVTRSTRPITMPVLVRNIADVAELGCGGRFTCVRTLNGEVWCWGILDFGRTGPVRVALPPSTPARALSVGGSHACAVLADSSVHCWGDNFYRQLGGVTAPGGEPREAGVTGAVRVACGSRHSCALLADGTAMCWGDNTSAQLGQGTAGGPMAAPVAVRGVSEGASIAAGGDSTCVTERTGTVACWGSNEMGQLALGSTTAAMSATPSAALRAMTDLSFGYRHACGRTPSGQIACWGSGYYGSLGIGVRYYRTAASTVASLAGIRRVALGDAHTCALDAANTLHCFGENLQGQLALTPRTPRFDPQRLSTPLDTEAVSGGLAATCAVARDGSLRCWGRGSEGQLGSGTRPAVVDSPTLVPGLPPVSEVDLGGGHTCAVTRTGEVYCWGDGRSGEVGNGNSGSSNYVPSPFHVVGLTNVRNVSLGQRHTCAVLTDGTVQCWGENNAAQLGDGSMTERQRPTPVVGLTNVVQVAAAAEHTCARTMDGSVWCWGSDSSGQLGDGIAGTAMLTMRPARVPALDAVDLDAGGETTCAVTRSGAVMCWGANREGQLGNGTTQLSAVPSMVMGAPSDAIAVRVGSAHACALRMSGAVACWGMHYAGQLGLGAWRDRHTLPAPVTF